MHCEVVLFFHQEQKRGRKTLRPVLFSSQSLKSIQMKYGALKMEILAAVTIVVRTMEKQHTNCQSSTVMTQKIFAHRRKHRAMDRELGSVRHGL